MFGREGVPLEEREGAVTVSDGAEQAAIAAATIAPIVRQTTVLRRTSREGDIASAAEDHGQAIALHEATLGREYTSVLLSRHAFDGALSGS